MQCIAALMLGFRTQLCDFYPLLMIVGRSFLHMRQFSLLFGNSVLHIMIWFAIIDMLTVGIDIKVVHGHIQPDCIVWINVMVYLFMRHFVQERKIVFAIRLMRDGNRLQYSVYRNLAMCSDFNFSANLGKGEKACFSFAHPKTQIGCAFGGNICCV